MYWQKLRDCFLGWKKIEKCREIFVRKFGVWKKNRNLFCYDVSVLVRDKRTDVG